MIRRCSSTRQTREGLLEGRRSGRPSFSRPFGTLDEMDTITPRQSRIFCLHYKDGFSFRRIALFLDVPKSTVFDEYDRVLAVLADAFVHSGPDTCTILVERLFSIWAESEQRQQPHALALRREQMAQDLERRMDARSSEIDDITECMGANCSTPHNRNKGAAWTHWEMAYLCARKCNAIPNSAYSCKVAGRYARLCNEIRS